MDGRGTVEPDAEQEGREVVYSFAGMPNFVGAALGYSGKPGNVRLRLPLPATAERLFVSVSGGEGSLGELQLDGVDWERRVALASLARPGEFSLRIPEGGGPVMMSVSPMATEGVCYLVLAGMRVA